MTESIYDPTVEVVYFTKHDPRRKALLIDKEKTSSNTLVHYDPPIAFGYERKDGSIRFYHAIKKSSGYARDNKMELAAYCAAEKSNEETREQLFVQIILPTQEWLAHDRYWRQKVCTTRANPRTDDILLDVDLIRMCKDRNAKFGFLSNTRREIFDQCYDEIIRRILLERPSRGLLLLQIRDGLRTCLRKGHEMWISQYGYNVRRSIEAAHLLNAVDDKRAKKRKEYVALLEDQFDMMEKVMKLKESIRKRKQVLNAKFHKELNAIKNGNDLLKKQLLIMTDQRNATQRNNERKKQRSDDQYYY